MPPVVRVAAVIPARMGSSRFPGKPLLQLHGLPMVEHVRRRALLCGRFSEVVVATCDEEIAREVTRSGGKVLMTSPHHPGATDRVAEAAGHLDCTHIINLQGDELLVLPEDLRKMVAAIEKEPDLPCWNAVAVLSDRAELSDRSIVKCLLSDSGRILFCLRDLSSLTLDPANGFRPAHKILGILGYRKEILPRYLALERTPYEIAESLDQCRLIEHDVPLKAVFFSKGYVGINERREVDLVLRCLQEDPAQQQVMREVLA